MKAVSRPAAPPQRNRSAASETQMPSTPKPASPSTSPKKSGKKTASHGVGSMDP